MVDEGNAADGAGQRAGLGIAARGRRSIRGWANILQGFLRQGWFWLVVGQAQFVVGWLVQFPHPIAEALLLATRRTGEGGRTFRRIKGSGDGGRTDLGPAVVVQPPQGSEGVRAEGSEGVRAEGSEGVRAEGIVGSTYKPCDRIVISLRRIPPVFGDHEER